MNGHPIHHSNKQGLGFSLAELMIATVIITIVVIGSVESALRSFKIFNQGAAREAIEAVIANDLSWLRAYSKSWHCEVGPYQGCKVKSSGIASAVNYRPEIFSSDDTSDYQQFKTWCNNRFSSTSTSTPAHQMLSDAASISATSSYAPPNPATSSETALNLGNSPGIASGYKLYRIITVDSQTDDDGNFVAQGNSATVRYYTKNTDGKYIRINKAEKLFVEATAWCP